MLGSADVAVITVGTSWHTKMKAATGRRTPEAAYHIEHHSSGADNSPIPTPTAMANTTGTTQHRASSIQHHSRQRKPPHPASSITHQRSPTHPYSLQPPSQTSPALPSIEHPVSGITHNSESLRIPHPASLTGGRQLTHTHSNRHHKHHLHYPASSIQYPVSLTTTRASASSIEHRASSIQHPASLTTTRASASSITHDSRFTIHDSRFTIHHPPPSRSH